MRRNGRDEKGGRGKMKEGEDAGRRKGSEMAEGGDENRRGVKYKVKKGRRKKMDRKRENKKMG